MLEQLRYTIARMVLLLHFGSSSEEVNWIE